MDWERRSDILATKITGHHPTWLNIMWNVLRFLTTTYIQREHKVFPDYKKMFTWTSRTLCCTSIRIVSSVDNFPTRWRTATLGFTCSSVFWMQYFQTGRLGETVRHPGHHDHRISPHFTSFYGGMLSTKCFRHQFEILQILKARLTDSVATTTEDTLENTWRETDCRLDLLRATKGAHVEVCWCVVKKKLLELHLKRKVCIPRRVVFL